MPYFDMLAMYTDSDSEKGIIVLNFYSQFYHQQTDNISKRAMQVSKFFKHDYIREKWFGLLPAIYLLLGIIAIIIELNLTTGACINSFRFIAEITAVILTALLFFVFLRTLKKQIQHSISAVGAANQRFTSLTDSLNLPVIETDTAGNILTSNDKAQGCLSLFKNPEEHPCIFNRFYGSDGEAAQAFFIDCVNKQIPTFTYNQLIERSDGLKRTFTFTHHLWVDSLSRQTRILISATDITESLQSKAKLDLLNRIAEQIGEGVAVADLSGKLIFINDAWAHMHGYTVTEMLGQNIAISHTSEQIETDVLPFNEFVNKYGSHRGEVGHVHRDGTTFITEMTTTVLRDDNDEAFGLIGIAQNISQRKKLDALFQHRIRVERAVARVSKTLSVYKEADINACLAMLGEAVEAHRAYIFTYHDDNRKCSNTHEWCSQETQPEIENRQNIDIHRLKGWDEALRHDENIVIPSANELPQDQKTILALAKNQPIQSLLIVPMWSDKRLYGFLGFDDVKQKRLWSDDDLILLRTASEILMAHFEQVEAANQLRNNEALFRTAFQLIPDSVGLQHFDNGHFVRINAAFQETFGYDLAEVLGKSDLDIGIWENHAQRRSARQIIEAHGEIREMEAVFIRRDGSRFVGSMSARRLDQQDGRFVLAIIRDITAAKVSERALRQSEENYRSIFEAVNDAIFVHDLETGKILDVNRKMMEMYGYNYEEATGLVMKNVCDDQTPHTAENAMTWIKKAAEGEPQVFEWRARRKDGSLFWTEVSLKRAIVAGEGRLLASVRDISDRKKNLVEKENLEMQLRQKQKLESIGTLASGVAHEINNPINGIMNYAQLIFDRLGESHPLSEFSLEIILESERIATIVRNLLAFSRQEKEPHNRSSIQEIVDATLTLVKTLLRKDTIRIDVELPSDLPYVYCRTKQIQQVLMNLITNARDALNEKFPGPHQNKIIRISSCAVMKQGQQWVRITAEDNGSGIPQEVLPRIFDPFFTTKSRDIGTGLGLSVSHGIIAEHGGEFTVDSKRGEFTRFSFDLKAAEK